MREIDLSHRAWGCNYEIVGTEGSGYYKLKLATWSTPLPREGDFLLLAHKQTPDGKTRYKVTEVELCGNPRDMAFVRADFAPRAPHPISSSGESLEGGEGVG